MDVAFSQETRAAGRTGLRPEYRPIIKFKGGAKNYARITLFEDADLNDYFQLRLYQGGNLIGTGRDKSFKKFEAAEFTYNLTPTSSTNKFNAKWSGWGLSSTSNSWSEGSSGANYYLFTKELNGAKIPKGEYVLTINAVW